MIWDILGQPYPEIILHNAYVFLARGHASQANFVRDHASWAHNDLKTVNLNASRCYRESAFST